MAESTSLQLLRARRFAPLFWTQALGAFNDNLFKQAMALLVAYRAGTASGLDAASLTAMAGATFVAPFIFLSAFAGSLADSMDKAVLARRLKLMELAIMAVAAVALVTGHLVGLFTVLFLLGCQAALFGPVKYSLLPTHLRSEELVAGNALVESATFIAILLGSILGGSLIGWSGGAGVLSGALLATAGLGYVCSRFIPAAAPAVPTHGQRPLRSGTIAVLSEAHANQMVWLSILGISWFWVVGATLLSFVPPLARDLLGGSEAVASFLLAVFSVGIAVGSQLCAKQLNGEITPRPVPFAALAMSGLLVLFALATAAIPVPAAVGQSLLAVLSAPGALVVSAVLFALAVTAGFYAVPLFAILQHSAPEEAKARTIGANNVVNSVMMVAAAVVTAALSSGLGLSLPSLALILAALNLVAAAIMLRLLSRIVLKTVIRALLLMVYGVETRGEENLKLAGERRVVVANHQSFLDGLVLAAFLPDDPVFAVDTGIAKRWWVKPLLSLVDFAPVDPANPMALKSLARAVEKGRTLVIFPEGRLTVTGSLMKVYDGPGLVADRTGADLIPVRLDGLQHTPFTRLAGRVARRIAPG
jgi:acyl-[acyl-carrier-protein]-phospholipid O-acyltransferase/long-chain-fatty-acid--[acyl-carrier-protein] ligase